MFTFLGNGMAWVKSHSPAILATIVALQNSHLIGASAGKFLSIIQGLLSVLGGT